MLAFRPLAVVCWLLLVAAAAAQPADRWYDFLARHYEMHEEDLDEFLLYEFDRFLLVYPDHDHAPDVIAFAARLLETDGQEHGALVRWLEIALRYPGHDQGATAREAVLRLASREREYEDVLDELRARLDAEPSGDPATRHYTFVELLSVIMCDDLHEAALAAYRAYGRMYPEDASLVRVLEWESRILAEEGDELEAVVTLARAEAMFGDDAAIPLVRHRRALLLAEELDQPERALGVLAELRASHPDHPVAVTALLDQAHIKAESGDHAGAAADLRAFADTHADDERTLDVLFELADLTYDRLEAWQRTDAIYEEIVTRYADHPRAVEALRLSARLNEKRLEDDARAAAQYARVAEMYPGVEDADEDLFRAAGIAEDDLEDRALAASYLELAMRLWPDSEVSRKAADKLKDLNED